MKSTQRNIYLKMKTLEEARALWLEKTFSLRTPSERVPVVEGLHRATAGPVTALRSVPHYHGAAMDGIAVRAKDTFGASDVSPRKLELGEEAFEIDTGDPLPADCNAVIMIEQVELAGKEAEIRSAAFPWQHVRKVGEDMVAGELLLPLQHRLRPADLGALLAAGVLEVNVHRRPRVWIQPTGTEVTPAAQATELPPGRIVEFNGTVLSAMVEECGGDPLLRPVIADDYETLKAMFVEAVESPADVVLVNAGSSAGSEDYTAGLVREMGEMWVHGVAMMPGKPTVLGRIRGKPVVGIPGYPVSAILAFEQFVRPLLHSLQGLSCPEFPSVEAEVGRKMPSKLGIEEFVRVILGRVQGKLVAMPLQRGAGVLTSLTRADGMFRIPREKEGVDVSETVSIRLLRPREELDHTLIMIGSHDNTVDLLANELKRRDSRVHLSSSNVGSLGGIMAVRRGQTHLAGSHLLDTESGDYNFSYIARYLKGVPVRVVQLAMREQGLLVSPGNPLNLQGVEDLLRPDVRFVNRQAGSGTRILLDYQLERLGLSPDAIQGYDEDEFTHMAVAVNVLSGRAQAGMAIYAAAKALGLDFIPVARERYDLIVPEAEWEDPKIRMLLDIVGSAEFRRMVEALGGYDVSGSGTLLGVWDGEGWKSPS